MSASEEMSPITRLQKWACLVFHKLPFRFLGFDVFFFFIL